MSNGENEKEISEFQKTLAYISENKKKKDLGGFNSIPFGLKALDRHVPGIMKGVQYLITANSGIGKTQLTKFLFVNQPYKFVKEHPELGIKLKILYFALEETKREFILTLISQRLKQKYGIRVTVLELSSMGEYSLSDDLMDKVEECREYFAELEECLVIYDNISNPFGIFKTVRKYARENGRFYAKSKEVNPEDTWFDTYIPNDSNEYVIVITDHLGLLQPEATTETNTLHGAMSKFSSEYYRKNITKHYKYAAVGVQQQASDKEKLQFTYKGESIESKLEPSLDGLGDCKLTQRDFLVVIGLFSPERYSIEKHLGYDIKILRDNYRSLSILKNRVGLPNLKKGLYFDGAVNEFFELPPVGSQELKKIYEIEKI